MKVSNQRSTMEWIDINSIVPNPLNPRKDETIRTEEMQEIIKKRGWEEPLTVYKKGKLFVVLSGHRRLFSAKKAKIKHIPCFIVDAPATHQEEIERIASLQSGRVDWTPFDWAKFTYDRWLAWGKPHVNSFSKEININKRTVQQYLEVMTFYPHHEIEGGLLYGGYSINLLFEIAKWIKTLKEKQPQLVMAMSMDLIRKTMLNKLTNNLIGRHSLRYVEFLDIVGEEQLQEWLISRNVKLEDFMLSFNVDLNKQNFNGSLISIGLFEKKLKTFTPKTPQQYDKAVDALEELKKKIDDLQNNFKSKKEQMEIFN
jgi:ParB/RepB/Spo0J family partition protein